MPAALELLALLPLSFPAPAEPARVQLDLSLSEGAIVGKITVADSLDCALPGRRRATRRSRPTARRVIFDGAIDASEVEKLALRGAP